jgi:putative transposase
VVIIDAQTAEGGTKGGLRSILQATTRVRRFKGPKRRILVDTLGLLLKVVVHPADVLLERD